jgi:hypothetical protein
VRTSALPVAVVERAALNIQVGVSLAHDHAGFVDAEALRGQPAIEGGVALPRRMHAERDNQRTGGRKA